MAVTQVATLTLKPDAYQAFLDQHRKAKAVLERCGARNVRLMGTILAGEATGTLAVSFEADDYASIGAVTDKLLADPDGMALLMSTNSASGPIAAFQSSIWSDIEV
jgi:hypothetical protein